MSTRKYFGTDGIRGIANREPINPETLVKLGKAIAKVFLKDSGKHRIIIGKDTRLSGYMIESALVAGSLSMGADVLLTGPIPTPGLAYLTKSMRCDAGIMISASHNPFEDNGIKIFAADGFKLPDEMESEIEDYLESGELEHVGAESARLGKAKRIDDALGRYTVHLKSCFPRNLSLEGLKIGFDGANGAAYAVGPQTFEELGAEVVARGVLPNGRNINSGFGSLYPEVVASLVQENKLDLGIAVDGDADRVVLVDEKGGIIDGDKILAICAGFYQQQGRLASNKIVSTVMSNLALEHYLQSLGIELIRTSVGDRYVLEAMRKDKIEIGGEQSGHMIFLGDANTGDGLLAALKVIEVMLNTGKSLSQLAKVYSPYPQILENIKVTKKPALESVPQIAAAIKAAETKLGSTGRILVRYSGTENKVRVMVECQDAKLCQQLVSDVSEIVEQQLGLL